MIDRFEELEEKIERVLKILKSTQDALEKAQITNSEFKAAAQEHDQALTEAKRGLARSEKQEKLVKAKLEKLVKRLEQVEPLLEDIMSHQN